MPTRSPLPARFHRLFPSRGSVAPTALLLLMMTAAQVNAQQLELNPPAETNQPVADTSQLAADTSQLAADASQLATDASQPAPEISPPAVIPSGPAPMRASELKLNAPSVTVGDQPVNSTLRMRVARRPWLLEKLTGPRTEPSVKMNPPSPPRDRAFDPPSITTNPIDPRRPLPDQGIWVLRNSTPAPAKSDTNRKESAAESKPTATSKPAGSPDASNDSETKSEGTLQLTPSESRESNSEKESKGSDASNTGATEDVTAASKTPAASADVEKSSVKSKDAAKTKPDSETGLVPRGKAPVVRELSVDPQILPEPKAKSIHEAQSAAKPSAPSPSTKPVAPSPSTKSPTGNGSRSRYVGTEPEDEIAPKPQIKLDYTGYPMRSLPLSRSVRSMQRPMRSCLQYYFNRPEIADERSNWGMLHQIMVYGVDTRVIVGRKRYSAIAWIAGNNPCRGQKLLINGSQGIEARSGVGLQGHQSQMLAIFALCGVPSDYPLYAGSEKFTVGDVVRAEMATCRRGAELTFTLIALSHYIDTDAAWLSDDGQQWDFERLIREELNQPIVGAACGGTHRLMGFAHALRKRRAAGKPIVGQWKRAELFTLDFQSYCYRLQNDDGSMSTDWFEGREDNGDLDRKIQTTGHMVEWLLTITPDSQLQNPRLVRAVRFLLNSMLGERGHEWKIGPKGHALRSLAMYYERVYRSGPAWRTPGMATSEESSYR